MTGVDIIGALLTSYEPLLAVVSEDSMKEELLPDDVQLPALLLRDVSSVERQFLTRGPNVHTRDRVAVTVRARNLVERAAVIKLVVACCAGKVGNVGGGTGVSILTDGRSPGMIGPAMTFEQTQDLLVGYIAGGVPGVVTVEELATDVDALPRLP